MSKIHTSRPNLIRAMAFFQVSHARVLYACGVGYTECERRVRWPSVCGALAISGAAGVSYDGQVRKAASAGVPQASSDNDPWAPVDRGAWLLRPAGCSTRSPSRSQTRRSAPRTQGNSLLTDSDSIESRRPAAARARMARCDGSRTRASTRPTAKITAPAVKPTAYAVHGRDGWQGGLRGVAGQVSGQGAGEDGAEQGGADRAADLLRGVDHGRGDAGVGCGTPRVPVANEAENTQAVPAPAGMSPGSTWLA